MPDAEITLVKREALFVKKSSIGEKLTQRLITKNTFYFFEERACKECEWHDDRLSSETKLAEACPNCAAFKGGIALAKELKIGGNTYLSVPAGTEASLKSVLKKKGDLTIKSKRPSSEFKRKIKFSGTLKDFQKEAVAAIIEKMYGVIKAPPRSGKTVLSTAAICKIGQKAIVLAAQREWLDGFYETFCGSGTQAALTTAKKNQVGFAKKYKDFLKYDVCLVTYQTFRSEKGKKLLEKIRDMFPVMVLDEVHMGAATGFATVVSRLNCKWKIGLSGTPSRKDLRYVVVEALIGPIIYEAKVERLKPTIKLVRTGYKAQHKGGLWTSMVSRLEKNPARLKLIAKWALKDVKDGHMVLIPLAQVTPIKALCLAINRMAGKRVAHPFFGGLKKDLRKKLIQDARNYKARILVGNTKLLSTGINIPRASAIYDTTLSSNIENCEQRVSRVLTPWEDKPPPILRIFLDDMNVRQRCLSNEWFNCIKPKFKPIITERDQIALKSYLTQKKSATLPSWEL
jgi:superfamily II DNA or RNA helicase